MSLEIEQIKKSLKQKLLGELAHKKMSRPFRVLKYDEKTNKAHKSSIAIILFEHQNFIQSILIQRPIYQGSHSGQVGFPGGKLEPNETLLDTSIRETREEIGLQLNKNQFIGELSRVYIQVSNFLLYPFVFYIGNKKPKLTLEKREVDDVYYYKINEINNYSNRKIKDFEVGKSILKNVPYFEIPIIESENKTKIKIDVWGATALVLSEFADLIKALK